MCVMHRLLWVILLGMLSAGGMAAPVGYVLERAYVVDDNADLDLETVRQRPAQRYEGVLSRGFTEAATWIRITVAPAVSPRPDERLLVRVRPGFLDEVRLFDPLDTSGKLRVTGDRSEWRDSEYKSLNHGFLIPASDQPRDIWLRLKTTSTSLIYVEVMTLEEAQQINRAQDIVYGLMMGTLLMFFLWAALQWSLRREVLMAAFTLSQVASVTHALLYIGYARILVADQVSAPVLDVFFSGLNCVYVLIGFVLHFSLLREFKPWLPGVRTVLGLGVTGFVTEMVLMSLGRTLLALQINMTFVAITPFLWLALSLTCRAWSTAPDDDPPLLPKWMLVSFYALVASALLLATVPALGFARAPEINLHIFLIHGLMTGTILIVLLQLRSHRIEQSRNRARMRAQSAAQQVEIEKQRSRLQGRFIEMLAHEVKTSLSVLHMVFGVSKLNPEMLEHGRRTVNNINQLIERCLQAERFDDNEIISHFENFSVPAVVEEALSTLPDRGRVSVVSEEVVSVRSDWQIFKSVLSNLVDNALKYSSPESTVVLSVRQAGRDGRAGCEVVVENQVQAGPASTGFPDRDELFKKYYRADGARKHSGSGLGLYLVANFMRLLGGDVRYEPLEKSVRFTVWLPN